MSQCANLTKRIFDILVATLALAILSPMLAVVAALIKITSPGPVFFRQGRLGKNGTPFQIYKFRSMRPGGPDVRNADGSVFTGASDSRVTAIGKFIRKTSIDELPQLINVVLGSMSLVGPRPDLVDQRALYTEIEERKLLVKPGMTGLAQISGRNTISWEERKRIDVEYVERQSIRLDFAILLKTIPYVLLSSGVHQKAELQR